MRPFVVIDSETDPFKHGRIPEPFIWGMFNGKEFIYYLNDNLHSLMKYLTDKKVIVYAHNGGKFDYHFLLSYLEPFDNVRIINGRLSQFFIGKAEFRDSYNILPVPLSAFEGKDADGNIVKKQEFDYSLMEKSERYKPDNFERIVEYLRDDCITLYQMISDFQTEYGRHLTQAGAAMAQWKKISGEKVPSSTKEYFNYFSNYYYGGRVECFKSGILEVDFSVFDINSAYPYAMLSEHAYGLDYIECDEELTDMARGPAFFRIKAASCGAFPCREKTGLRFPSDGIEREFFITGWELQAAIDTGTAGDYVVLGVIYHTTKKNFAEYINHFYKKRLTAQERKDIANDLFSKLFMNGLYGKFGANPDNYSDFLIMPPDEMESLLDDENEYSYSGDLGPWILAERDLYDDEQKYFNVATAASITGFVRAYLWRAICATGRDKILYCDTDSIVTMSEGHELDTGKQLGMWKHEGEFDKAGIAGKKMYIFRGKKDSKGKREYKTASKGVKLSNSELWKVAGGTEVTYNPENPSFSVHSTPRFVSRRINLTM